MIVQGMLLTSSEFSAESGMGWKGMIGNGEHLLTVVTIWEVFGRAQPFIFNLILVFPVLFLALSDISLYRKVKTKMPHSTNLSPIHPQPSEALIRLLNPNLRKPHFRRLHQ